MARFQAFSRVALLPTLIVLALAACGESADDVAPADTSAPPPEVSPSAPSTTRLDVELVPTTTKPPATTAPPATVAGAEAPEFTPGDDPVDFAKADLAFQLGVSESAIVLVEQVEVIWRDGSIGCPQPGMSYTQALVDGSKIVLAVNGEEYFYHQGGGRAPFLCLTPTEG